nr:hypothetical protein [Alysiella crassa]UOP06170.1 hypothetical protein LVJ80_10080 [Alysiella crassa]
MRQNYFPYPKSKKPPNALKTQIWRFSDLAGLQEFKNKVSANNKCNN